MSSRNIGGERVPQHVQNIVIRDYCRRKDIDYLLSATEYAMSGSFMMLRQVINELSPENGVVFYSIMQLPDNNVDRRRLLLRIIEANSKAHFAVESLVVGNLDDVREIDDILMVRQAIRGNGAVEDLLRGLLVVEGEDYHFGSEKI